MKKPYPDSRFTGQVVGSVLGFQGIWGELLIKPLYFLLSISSLAMRMIVRKSQGQSLLMVGKLILNILISIFVIYNIDGEFSYGAGFFLSGILIGTLYHFFVDAQNTAHEMARSPYYAGIGILASRYSKGNYSRELALNLTDGIIAGGFGWFLYYILQFEGVGIIVLWGGGCLFFETLLLLIEDRKMKEDMIRGDATSAHYGGGRIQGGKRSEEQNWRNPKI